MKSEQLLNALNNIDDSLIEETNPFQEEEITKPVLQVTGGTGKGGKRKMRKGILLVAVCAVLLFSGVAAYAATGGDLLKIVRHKGTDGDGETTVEYQPIEKNVVPMSKLRGEIQNAPAEIKKQVDEFNAIPEMERMALSTMPDVLTKKFDTLEAAIDYIGYDQLNFPKLNYPTEDVHIDMLGCETADGYSLSTISLDTMQQYRQGGIRYYQTIATIFTENANASSAMILALSEKVKLAQEQRVADGRTFSILHTNEPDPYNEGAKVLSTEVFTTDNNVVYLFHISYDEANRADAEAVIEEWINSFSGN